MNNRIVECAVGAGSEYIVTKDKDLLRLGELDASTRVVRRFRKTKFPRSGLERSR
jgi:predicted nucleic acid-binding protein